MLTLFHHPLCPFSRFARLALAEFLVLVLEGPIGGHHLGQAVLGQAGALLEGIARGDFHGRGRDRSCLLYTSPSPRD